MTTLGQRATVLQLISHSTPRSEAKCRTRWQSRWLSVSLQGVTFDLSCCHQLVGLTAGSA